MTSTWLPDPTSSTGTPLAWTSTTETSWLLSAPFQNVTDAIPAAGSTIAGNQTLGAFGTPLASASGTMVDQSLGFHGQYLDSRTGLYNVRARDYSAPTGRFTATDPIAIPHGSPYANGYTYAFGNPMTATDPSGLTPDWIEAVGGWFSSTGSYVGNEAVGAWNGAKETANAAIHPIQTYNGMVATCNDGFDQMSGGTGATFDGFLQCVDNLNPAANVRRDVAAALNADCETDSAQAMGHALFGAGMLAAPGIKGTGLKSFPFKKPSSAKAPAAAPKAPAARLPQDVAVNPVPTLPLALTRPVGRPSHNAALQADLATLGNNAKSVRVNQQQVNAAGERVGVNRPDLQYTLNGQRHYVEYEGMGNPRGAAHEARILANDPGAVFILRLVP